MFLFPPLDVSVLLAALELTEVFNASAQCWKNFYRNLCQRAVLLMVKTKLIKRSTTIKSV